jgi:hypothetical protein
LIHKLVTGAITATITAVTAAIAAAVTAAIAATVTAAIAATVTTAIAATIDTARRRRRRSIDTARRRRRRRSIDTARRRRRRSIDLATAAPVIAATGAHRAKERGTEQRRSKEEAKCFDLGRNGGGSECESCSGHDGYPA